MPPLESADQRIVDALEERDRALLALACAREELDALRQALRRAGEVEPPLFPVSAGLTGTPLRYVLVDRLNDLTKKFGEPAHRLTRRFVGRVLGNRR